jgi:hypothetical protein
MTRDKRSVFLMRLIKKQNVHKLTMEEDRGVKNRRYERNGVGDSYH